MSARNRACSLKAKEILAQRALRQGVCGRAGCEPIGLSAGVISTGDGIRISTSTGNLGSFGFMR
jgi:hypothetical protein